MTPAYVPRLLVGPPLLQLICILKGGGRLVPFPWHGERCDIEVSVAGRGRPGKTHLQEECDGPLSAKLVAVEREQKEGL